MQTPLIFDSLADAERYSQDKIAVAGVGCRIYDRDGKVIRTFTDIHQSGCADGASPDLGVFPGVGCLRVAGLS